MKDIENTVKNRKAELKNSVEVLERIAAEGAVSDSDLRLLIDKIEIGEKDGKLDITVIFNGKFRQHIDLYNNGELDESYTESWYMEL